MSSKILSGFRVDDTFYPLSNIPVTANILDIKYDTIGEWIMKSHSIIYEEVCEDYYKNIKILRELLYERYIKEVKIESCNIKDDTYTSYLTGYLGGDTSTGVDKHNRMYFQFTLIEYSRKRY